ncbi:MAG TPA: cysteine desulfurase-like protein [Propionibacteriaceae bacterium]|nr:cysteine desulfurase-like protein [Propionibacteriaceae bacterium]
MTFDVHRVRGDFPALAGGLAFFDSPGGTQTPQSVADAIAGALQQPLSNRGGLTPAQRNAEETVRGARAAMADLLGADPRGVVFGRSATSLTFEMSRTLARAGGWGPGDEVVVTRLDHDANVRPWLIAAGAVGATARFVDFDAETGELTLEAVTAVLSERTRLVAVTAASNLIGTIPDMAAIADRVHRTGALLYVDGVHYTAHAHVDIHALGADFFICSPYKFLGPHLGVLAADPAVLEALHPDKLAPSTDAVPERFELGTLPYEMLAGVTAAVDYWADLTGHRGSRRDRLAAARSAVKEYEAALTTRLESGLAGSDRVTLYSRATRRTSTLLFTVDGLPAARVAEQLAQRDLSAPAGHFYAPETSRSLGLGDTGGVRAGIALYNDEDDINRLLEGVRALR